MDHVTSDIAFCLYAACNSHILLFARVCVSGHGLCPEGFLHRAGILLGLFDCFPVGGMPSFSVAERNVKVELGK